MVGTAYDKESPETIQAMFGSIAKRYDRANAVNSFQLHKRWNKELLRLVTSETSPESLLDLCCGTGDIGLAYLKQSSGAKQAVLLDFCGEMLECAKQKAEKMGLYSPQVTFIQGDAQALPFAEGSMACATVAYGIRNVKDPLKCVREVYRVLKPGGIFGILELTRPTNPLLRIGHQIYLRTVLPFVGRWLTSNQEAYKYLCRSIHHFIPPAELEQHLVAAGFTRTSRKSLAGGIATILIGHKERSLNSDS